MKISRCTNGRVSVFVAICVVLVMITTSLAMINAPNSSAESGLVSTTADVNYFDFDGSLIKTDKQAGVIGTEIEIFFDEIQERAGYAFAGWADAIGGDVKYSALDGVKSILVILPEGGLDLYAVWTKETGSKSFAHAGTSAFMVLGAPMPPKSYYITATADASTSISPPGQTTVLKGDSMIYTFSAEAGKAVSAVLVDGKELSPAEIKKGYYSFRDMKANHTIQVYGKDIVLDISLTINVNQSYGYVEYSINGSEFVRYTGPVSVPEYAEVTMIAFANNGNDLVEWKQGSESITEYAITFSDVQDPIFLELSFVLDNSSSSSSTSGVLMWLAVIAVLFILAVIAIRVIFYARTYRVINAANTAVTMDSEKAYRKKGFYFNVKKGSGKVFYRVGEGDWKAARPAGNGEYFVPRKDVIGNLTIDVR